MKPARSLWLTNVEIYKAIGVRVPSQCIQGIQRIRDMWRIYMDNEEDRLSLLVQGLVLRGRQIPLHSQNPYNPGRTQPDTIRIKVKNVPLSADDGQIHRALTLEGCEIQGLFRERLRVDGKLTNCETGDRLIISKTLKTQSQESFKLVNIGLLYSIVVNQNSLHITNKIIIQIEQIKYLCVTNAYLLGIFCMIVQMTGCAKHVTKQDTK